MADVIYPGETPGGTLGQGYLPRNYDLVLYRGDYFSLNITLMNGVTPIDLTGYTAKCEIRDTFEGTTIFPATVTTGGTDGVVNITFPSSVTTDMVPGSYLWDVQVTDTNGNTRTYLAGDVNVLGEVTK